MPGSEASRREEIQKLQVFARLFINGNQVSETRKANLRWPSFEAEICEMFQVHVFTLPGSIQIQIVVQDGLRTFEVDLLDVEVPGEHVRSLTCASQLI